METPTQLAERLADAAAGLPGADEMAALPAAELVALTAAIERLGRATDARRVAAAAAIERRSGRFLGSAGLAQSFGYRTGADLLQQITGVTGAEARRRARLGELVCPREDAIGSGLPAYYPEVSAAMGSGTLGVDAARAITGELEATGTHVHPGAVRIAERFLVAAAIGSDAPIAAVTPEDLVEAGLTADELAEATAAGRGTSGLPLPADHVAVRARVWRDVLDPDGVEPRADVARHNRQVTLSRVPTGGLHTLRGRLTPDVAAGLFAFFDTLIARPRPTFLPAGDGDGAAGRGGSDAAERAACCHAGDAGDAGDAADARMLADRRSHPQRCHDLLAGMIRAASAAVNAGLPEAADDTSDGDGVPDAGTLPGTGDAPDADDRAPRATMLPVPAPVPLIVTADAAQLAKGFAGNGTLSGIHGPVPLSYLAQIACDGGLQALLTRTGRPVKLRTPGRFFTPGQRRAAAARDGTVCVIPGCDMPFPALEAHHVEPFSRGGPTTVDNCALLCWWHHHLIDAGIWAIQMVRGRPRIRIPIRGYLPLAA